MLYREIIAVCSQIHTKHINTPCGQDTELPAELYTVSVPTLQETESVSVTKASRLKLFRETVAVVVSYGTYQHINTLCGQNPGLINV